MATKTTSTTGIGVRGGTLQLGGLATQPVPFVAPSTFPVPRVVSPIVPAVAPPAVAAALRAGTTPQLPIAVNDVIAGNISRAVQGIIPKALNTVQVRPITGNTPIRIIPSILLNQRKPNEETLSLSRMNFSNGTFQQANLHGISVLRPEIISLMDFEPVYFGTTLDLNDVGLLMDVQYQARHLREQTFFQLMSGIQQTDQRNELSNLQMAFVGGFQRVNAAADFYNNTMQTIETMKNGFDVKDIPSNNFDLRNYRTLRDFYQTFMMFPADVFNQFSGTKILMQLLFDARSIAEGYSMNLLSLSDPDRQAGGAALTSPISIDKTYNTRAGFSFTYDTIRSFNQPQNAAEQEFFNRFNSSLPQSPDDRIKLLVNMLSKELRVSRGLGRLTVQNSLQQKFNAATTDGSPFDNIIGGVGNTIFDPVTGPGSIANLTVINNTDNSAVLPFETKYIDTNSASRKTYIPGSVFFVDSILNVETLSGFNIEPLRSYVSKYMETVDNATDVISSIFDYGTEVSPISPMSLFKLILEPLEHSIRFLSASDMFTSLQNQALGLSTSEAVAVATFKLAANNPELKALLFQYLLLRIVAADTGTAFSRTTFFVGSIIEDLNRDIRNLSGVSLNRNAVRPNLYDQRSLFPYITGLAQTIQAKIIELVNQRTITGDGANAQTTTRQPDPATGLAVVGCDIDTSYGFAGELQRSRLIEGFAAFFIKLDAILGNEVNNIMDSSRRTRYHSLSGSTLALLAFEAFLQLICRYVGGDFHNSTDNYNIPNVVIDTNFNARTYNSLQSIIAETQPPLPIIEVDPGTNSAPRTSSTTSQTQRLAQSHHSAATQHVVDQTARTATLLGVSPGAVQTGVSNNQSILAGQFATAGSRFTDATALALRNVTPTVNPQDLLDAHAIDASLNSISHKLFQEDFSLACVMHILQVIKRRLRSALDLASNYFTQQTLNSLASLNATSIQDIGQNLDPAQVRILLRQRYEYVRQLASNTQGLQFIPGSPTDTDTRAALLSLLGRDSFRDTNDAAFRYRLLTVGIPAGFSKNLVERINGNNIVSTTFLRKKEFDVVTVNVYKRSLEFPQLVFKPRKYIFDLSLFPNGYKNLRISANENFDRVLQRITLLDYQNFSHPTTITLQDVANSERYAFIPDPLLKRAMVENHVLSDLFASYVQFLTTMELAESTFVNQQSQTYQRLSVGDGTDLSPQFSELVRKYLLAKRTADIQNNPSLSPLPDIPIKEMLVSQQVDQATKDLLRLLTFGNIAFKLENALASMLSPKIFERVFTIPVNVDDFEIDYQQTTAAESGRDFLEKTFFQEMLDRNALAAGVYKLAPRTHKDTIFEDYFVTIELVE